MDDRAEWSESQAIAATNWDITPDAFVVAACRGLRPGAALELGAGDGRNALWLAGRGWRVTAIERATVAVGRLQGRSALLNRPVEAIAADAVSYRPAPASLDLVLLSYVDLSEPRLRHVFANSVPGLTAGGMVLVVGHDRSNLDGGWGGPRDPDRLTTPEHLAGLLSGLGLQVRRAEVVRREVRGDVGVRTALDHVVEAVRPAA